MKDDDQNDTTPPSVRRDLRIQAMARDAERQRVMKILRAAHPPIAAATLAAVEGDESPVEARSDHGRGGQASSASPWASVTSKLNQEQSARREAKTEAGA